MLEFIISMGINLKAAMAAAMTVWTLLTAQGYAVKDINNLLEYVSCITYDVESDEYVVAAVVTSEFTDQYGNTWEAGDLDSMSCDSLGELLDGWFSCSKEELETLENHSRWITYREYLELSAAREG